MIADVLEEDDFECRLELIVYRHTPDGYERIKPDERGWIWLEPIGVWLGIAPEARLGYDRLACFDPATGEEIGDYTAISQALEAAETQGAALAEAQAQAEAETLRSSRGENPSAGGRAEAAWQRAAR